MGRQIKHYPILCWRFEVIHEVYKIQAPSKNAGMDILRNVFPNVERESVIITQISKVDFDEMDCKELTEDSVGEHQDQVY